LSQLSLRVARSPASSPSQRKSNSKVATRIVKPFVFEEDSRLTGFSVELWNEIAKQLNVAVTSNLTLQQLRSDINDAKDLPGKRVASVQGSTASEYLRQQSIEARDYSKIEDAYPALQDGQLDAVVYAAPVLLYFASHEGKGRSKPSVRSFAKKTTASLFRIKARYANGSTRHCSS
jgi:ABC-type amino acid transport substrate-binding protein